MFLDVFINLLSDICFITFTTILLLVTFFAKHSNFFHKFRSLINPERRVVVYKNNINFNKINFCEIDTSFRQVVSNTDKELIIENYRKRNNKAKLFDGENVRLESITNDNIELSKVNFFDFVCTNLALHPSNITVNKGNFFANNLNLWRGKDLYKNLNTEYKKYGKIVTFEEAINCKVLANIITVSILVIDKNKKLGIVKRSTNVSVSSGNFSTTSAGSVSVEDLKENNPILNCVKRELNEELNISAKEINFDKIVISKQKMQPAFFVSQP